MLKVIDHLPDGLLELEVHQLYRALSGPVLIHLAGRRQQPLFVSLLQHGNESTGWYAIRSLLKKYQTRELPRSLSIFIGNVEAAQYNQRYLDHQPDYNRSWQGPLSGEARPEHRILQQVVDEMRKRNVFASIDVHNNTGLNPHYACVNKIDRRFFHLATLFSREVVYFTKPDGVQSKVFAELCPSVTLECGQSEEPHSVTHAEEYIDACLHLSEFPAHPVEAHDIDLFHTVAIVKIPSDISFCFNNKKCDIQLADDLDHMNFRELPVGTSLGKTQLSDELPLDVRDEEGHEVGQHFFNIVDGEIRTAVPIMPSMLSIDDNAIRKDCLCYLMERYPLVDS